jgi:hypothetical protein
MSYEFMSYELSIINTKTPLLRSSKHQTPNSKLQTPNH